MKFPYYKAPSVDPGRKWTIRPLIPIRVFGPKDVWEGYALVDSGADRSLLHTEIAQKIGIDLSRAEKHEFLGISKDPLPALLQEVEIQIIGSVEKIKLGAGFVDSPYVFAILGQEGFFDEYRIKFERDRNLIEITTSRY